MLVCALGHRRVQVLEFHVGTLCTTSTLLNKMNSYPLLTIAATLIAQMTTCGAGTSKMEEVQNSPATVAPSEGFSGYWYQGKAEVNRYALTQARYGELRNGDAIMVFVTEDFLVNEQVKFEGGSKGPKTGVLKLNWIERFNAGIYDYSLMTSVFSPVDQTPALKVTCSVQDWCGQAFVQLNHRKDGYRMESRSYFEQEGDEDKEIGKVWLEDAFWNQIRIDPTKLPIGKVKLLPSVRYLRLMHKPHEAVDANATVQAQVDTTIYAINFPTLERDMTIKYATNEPHTIFGWSETSMDGHGTNAQKLTSVATLTHQVMEPYWGLNSNADDSLRSKLGLPPMPVR